MLTGGVPTTEDLADDLASAVHGHDIFAVYQPQVSLESGSIVGAEALCRWRHPRLGDIDPVTMIDVAETTGLIHALGRRMIAECLDKVAEWRGARRDWAVAVNVSPLQFQDERFASEVAADLAHRGFAPGSLVLELDMHPLEDPAVLPQLRMLRETGVDIALAGYGVDSPSSDRLRGLPLTEVKLPGTLVRAAEGSALASLRDEVEVAHAHGLRVVAEGIETLTHLDNAVRLGCDRAQGFLIRQPDPEISFP